MLPSVSPLAVVFSALACAVPARPGKLATISDTSAEATDSVGLMITRAYHRGTVRPGTVEPGYQSRPSLSPGPKCLCRRWSRIQISTWCSWLWGLWESRRLVQGAAGQGLSECRPQRRQSPRPPRGFRRHRPSKEFGATDTEDDRSLRCPNAAASTVCPSGPSADGRMPSTDSPSAWHRPSNRAGMRCSARTARRLSSH